MDKNLKTILAGAMEVKNLSPAKVAQETNIPERYISALQNLEIDKLPAIPYVRAYLKKIAEVLNLNYEELWVLYEKELSHKTSGAFDTLPTNRFAIHSLDKKVVVIGIVFLLFVIYVLTNAGNFLGTPPLEVFNPKASTIAVFESSISLEGKINPKDKLIINGEEVINDEAGDFQTIFNLQPGLNTIEFKVRRFLGKETTITKRILYQPEINQQPTTND